jgi:uncharacterized protein YuzE
LENLKMKVSYDPEADVLCLRLSTEPIDEGDELEPGVIVSYDSWGRVVSIEILHASTQTPDSRKIEFAVAPTERQSNLTAGTAPTERQSQQPASNVFEQPGCQSILRASGIDAP